jgi:hypothetical protein
MKLFLDKKTGEYKVKVNTNAPEKSLRDIASKTPGVADKTSDELFSDFNTNLDSFRFIWTNSGSDMVGNSWTIEDMYSTPDAPWMMPKVVAEQAIEAIEPQLLMTSLLKKIQYTMGQAIILPMTSAMSSTNLDMSEGDEYPETKLASGGMSQMIANIGKVGLAVKITEEMIRYSQFDVIGLHVKAAGKLLARHKEVKAANMISSQGVTYFDNLNPGQSVLGVTHGRDIAGAANGSLTAEDMLDLEGHFVAKGFMPNTMILHPLFYTMFRKDPVMRDLFFKGNATYFQSHRGSAQGGNPWQKSAGLMQGKQQNISETTPVALRNRDIDSAPIFPSYWGMDGMQIIVTPWAPYNPLKKRGDIIVCDKEELGVLLVDEELTTEEWNDPARDIKKIKFRERYCFGIMNEGQSVAVLKNVVNTENKIIERAAVPHYELTVDLSDIPATTPVVTA